MHDGFISGRSLASLDSCYERFQGPYPSLVPRQRLQHRLLVAVAEGYVRLRSDRNPACTMATFADAASFHSTAATKGFQNPYPSLVPRQRLQLRLLVAVAEGYVRSRSDRNPACTMASVPDAASHHSTAATKGFQNPYPSLVPRQRLQHRLLVAVAEGYVRSRSDRNPACTTASFADAASFHSTAATKVFKALTATTTPLLVAVAEGYVRLRSDRNPACTTAAFPDAASLHSTAATKGFQRVFAPFSPRNICPGSVKLRNLSKACGPASSSVRRCQVKPSPSGALSTSR